MTKVSERESAALKELAYYYGSEADCLTFKHIAISLNTDVSSVRRSVRALARKGLAELVRGLFTDDGFLAGSGYRCTKAGKDLIDPEGCL